MPQFNESDPVQHLGFKPNFLNDVPEFHKPVETTETYLGVKIISAQPMDECTFLTNHKKQDCSNRETRSGYFVMYEDSYTSWSPKEVFEKAYRRIDNLTFGLAIEAMKKGKYVARSGWNGKGMYIFLIGDDMYKNQPGIGGWTYTNGKNDNIQLLPFIAMKTVDGKVVPWLASQTDMLSEDWRIVE